MSDVTIILPKLGESIQSATVVQWFKKEGDFVKEDEPLLEVTTDKVNSEIPSTASGVLTKIIAGADKEIEVGAPLAVISSEGEAKASQPKVNSEPERKEEVQQDNSNSGYLSPAVLKLASEHGISFEKLTQIKGTGQGGRVSKKDIEAYLAKGSDEPTQNDERSGVEKVKMTGMRKAIADNMVKSFYEAPHASLVTEVDVTKIVKYIKANKDTFLKEHGFKLTITSYIAHAIAKALHEYPLLNSSLENDTIVLKRFVNLGIAVSVEQGVMVPVIRSCQNKSLVELAEEVSKLATLARDQKLNPDHTQNGTITMTNFGMSGTLIGIPIIRHPEVAIIGVGAISKKVVATDDETFGVRSMMHISLTFDHRVLDGMYGCGFLKALKDHIEKDSVE